MTSTLRSEILGQKRTSRFLTVAPSSGVNYKRSHKTDMWDLCYQQLNPQSVLPKATIQINTIWFLYKYMSYAYQQITKFYNYFLKVKLFIIVLKSYLSFKSLLFQTFAHVYNNVLTNPPSISFPPISSILPYIPLNFMCPFIHSESTQCCLYVHEYRTTYKSMVTLEASEGLHP